MEDEFPGILVSMKIILGKSGKRGARVAKNMVEERVHRCDVPLKSMVCRGVCNVRIRLASHMNDMRMRPCERTLHGPINVTLKAKQTTVCFDLKGI